MSDTLKKYRTQIDALDDEILALLEKRAQVAQQVGEEKRQQNMPYFSVVEREAQILRRQKENSTLLAPHITAIYREIIAACLACEQPVQVAYLGPTGTYTHEAALKMFGHAAVLSPMETIEATLLTAEKGDCDFAVLPFENSAAGTVGATMDALVHTPLVINGETVLRIRHNLLSADDTLTPATVKEIHAHPQALEQCRGWIEKNAPQATLHAADSNAAAAKLATTSKAAGMAIIASHTAQEIYQLSRLAENIEDFNNNSTRFLILGQQQPQPSGADKTSFIMSVKEEAGAMFRVLKPLADNNINMTKFESRPARGQLWEYLFFIDCIGHQQNVALTTALAEVKQRASFIKILGSYPQAID